MSRKITFLVLYDLGNFHNSKQSGFWIISKITLVNLRKPVLNFLIILVSSDLLHLENVKRKRKKVQKIEFFQNEKSSLDIRKSIFIIFWNAFFWENINRGHKLQRNTATYIRDIYNMTTPFLHKFFFHANFVHPFISDVLCSNFRRGIVIFLEGTRRVQRMMIS